MNPAASRSGIRRVLPLGMLAALATVPALALAGVWQYAEANVPAPTTTTTTVPREPAPALTTDVLSYRRHPTPIAERAAEAEAAARYATRVAGVTDRIGTGSCVQIRRGADVVAAVAPDEPVIPASNQKLLVAAVALEVLGPDHRFRTELRAPRPIGGAIPGDLYLVGGGDPLLRTADVPDPLTYPSFNTTALEPVVDRLVALGVTRIDGDVVGDGSRYDDEFRVPSWGDGITTVDAGPYDALVVNDGLIGPRSPGDHGLVPERTAAAVLYDLLIARGITVTGSIATRPQPSGADLTTLAFVESRPLTDVLVEMLHTSDNLTAEMLVKEIGVQGAGQGTRPAGLGVARETLARWNIPLIGVALEDGSGLSRDDRLTCSLLASLIASTPVSEELRGLLPVAGRDGTLTTQLLDTAAEGRLRAKTGTLDGVKALTGEQPGADGRPVEFSLVLNGPGVDEAATYRPLLNQLVELIADYPLRVDVDVDEFSPR